MDFFDTMVVFGLGACIVMSCSLLFIALRTLLEESKSKK